jgi:hypothetical protein
MTLPHLLPAPPGFPPRQSPAGALEALAREIPGPLVLSYRPRLTGGFS